MNYWLVKTEPSVYSIDDLQRDKTTPWDAIRNYQARNFLKEMKKGDLVLIYHSNAKPPGVAGVATVTKEAYPDALQFDKKSDYYDPKATKDQPRWFNPDLKFSQKFPELLPLDLLREQSALKDMTLLQKGSRLSVHKLKKSEFTHITKLATR